MVMPITRPYSRTFASGTIMFAAVGAVALGAMLFPMVVRDLVASLTWVQPSPSADAQRSATAPLAAMIAAVVAAATSSLIVSVAVRRASGSLRLAAAVGIAVALALWSFAEVSSAATASGVFLSSGVAACIAVWMVPVVWYLARTCR